MEGLLLYYFENISMYGYLLVKKDTIKILNLEHCDIDKEQIFEQERAPNFLP